MAGRAVQEHAKIAARYEVWNCTIMVQRWWRAWKGRDETLRPETITNCHAKLMTTGSVHDARESGRPKSRSTENVGWDDADFMNGLQEVQISLHVIFICRVTQRRYTRQNLGHWKTWRQEFKRFSTISLTTSCRR